MTGHDASEAAPTEISVRVRLTARSRKGIWAIGYQRSDGECAVTSGVVPAGADEHLTRADAAVAALAAVLDIAPALGKVALDLGGNLGMRSAFFTALQAFPDIRLSTCSHKSPYRTAVKEALNALDEPARLRVVKQSLVVAADASLRTNGTTAGLGWVVATVDGSVLSCGKSVRPVTRRGDIVLGELAAINRGLAAAKGLGFPPPEDGTVTVLTDSRAALATLRKVREGKHLAAVPLESIKEAEAVLAVAAGYPVAFEWVKGHVGHHLNEAADRLAVMARRNREFGVTRAVGDRMFKDLRAELLEPAAA